MKGRVKAVEAHVETAMRRDGGGRGGRGRESRNSRTPKLALGGGSGLSLSSSTRRRSSRSFGQGTGCDKDWTPRAAQLGNASGCRALLLVGRSDNWRARLIFNHEAGGPVLGLCKDYLHTSLSQPERRIQGELVAAMEDWPYSRWGRSSRPAPRRSVGVVECPVLSSMTPSGGGASRFLSPPPGPLGPRCIYPSEYVGTYTPWVLPIHRRGCEPPSLTCQQMLPPPKMLA